jgi:uncharacterized cupin superfamily protein
MDIRIDRSPTPASLSALGVDQWPTWESEVCTFSWGYDEDETCYFLDGDVVVRPEHGEPVAIGPGDLVTFPAGLKCTWEVRKPVRKHYRLG